MNYPPFIYLSKFTTLPNGDVAIYAMVNGWYGWYQLTPIEKPEDTLEPITNDE